MVRHLNEDCPLERLIPMNRTPRLNFEVRHELMGKEALIGCFVCMSFAGSFIEVVGDGITLGLG